MVTEESIKQFSVQCSRIFEETGKDRIGQSEVVENTIVALIAGGNVLLEGVPGVGKTLLVLGKADGIQLHGLFIQRMLRPGNSAKFHSLILSAPAASSRKTHPRREP